MKSNRVLLFKDFNAVLPAEFVAYMLFHAAASVIYCVNGKNDFNRWELWVRSDPHVLDAISNYNKLSNDSLDPFFKLVSTETDPFSGWIECDELGKERWIAGSRK